MKTAATNHISEQLAKRLGPHRFDMWFGQCTRLIVDGDRLDVATDSQFVADWIDSHFSPVLHHVAQETLGDSARIEVRVAPELFHDSRNGQNHAPPAAEGRGASNGRGRHVAVDGAWSEPRRPSPGAASLRRLEEFVVGPCNRLAYTAALRLADSADGSNAAGLSPLFIHGECGVGKTHLLQGICERVARVSGRAAVVRYVTGEQFTNEYITAVRSGNIEAFRRRTRRLDLLAIDDVHFLSNKVATQGEFLHTLDAIDLSGARVVLASDEHPRHIRRFSQALISRFLSGMVVQIEPPTMATRQQLIQKLSGSRRLGISGAAIQALAARCVGSVRELEGALTKLAALQAIAPAANGSASCPDGEIGLLMVDQLLSDATWQPKSPIKMAAIIDAVCRTVSVDRTDLVGTSRHRRVVLARGLIAHLARELTTLSYPEIAQSLGRSFHSTVHTAAQRLRRQMDSNHLAEAGPDGRSLPIRELADQIRHDILRQAAHA